MKLLLKNNISYFIINASEPENLFESAKNFVFYRLFKYIKIRMRNLQTIKILRMYVIYGIIH